MIQYYYTKLRLFIVSRLTVRAERRAKELRAKLDKLHMMITAGFFDEKKYIEFNRKLLENKNRELTPEKQQQLENFRQKHYKNWKPKKHFKDSKDKHAQQEGQKRINQHSEYVRVLKNRPLKPNPSDLVNPGDVTAAPLDDMKGKNNG